MSTLKSTTLSAEEQKFVDNIVNGMANADAFRDAFPERSQNMIANGSIDVAASRLINSDKIKTELEVIKQQIRKQSIMVLDEKLEFLKLVIENPNNRMADRLKAIDLSAKLQQLYVNKTEMSGGLSVTHSITPEVKQALDNLFE